MATRAFNFSSNAVISSCGPLSARNQQMRPSLLSKRPHKGSPPSPALRPARTVRVFSVAEPKKDDPAVSKIKELFVTEQDRRASAKSALFDVMPQQPIGTTFSNAIKEAMGECLLVLEHMCPVSNPAAQSLDGTWEVVYADTTTPGTLAAKALLSIPFPKGFAEVDTLKLVISGSEVKAEASVKLLKGPKAILNLVSKMQQESDVRVRESYVKGCLSMPELGGEEMMSKATEGAMANVPSIAQETVLEMLTRATPLLQRVGKGIEIPLEGSYERVMLISYLDNDLMVARNLSGTPEVLRRLPDPVVEPEVDDDDVTEYDEDTSGTADNIDDTLTL
eukprot:CAMPEP_0198212420 /NCGR_PEP_ID=MMETSP1445-20131203/25965_1 /TAXON_ID=36898 /ORGANISM="Pyramimonas sp., Strain CCMP2087" /LENGTH=334 /DNA_ID=CAMNT_0043886853 /DNA_START=58 /DNA_END=1062 /DNA_ORIENTATION=-